MAKKAPFDVNQWQTILGSIGGVGDDSKSKNKQEKKMAELQARLQQQLQEQQQRFQIQQQQQQITGSLEQQRQQQQFQTPFMQADLTGQYNGQYTMQHQQQQFTQQQQLRQAEEDKRQYNTTFGEQQRQFNQNFGLQERQLGETQREFEQRIALERQQFGEGQRQFNQTFGLQERQFNQQNQQFGQTFAEQQRQFNAQQGMQQQQFGETQREFNERMAMEQSQYGQTFAEQQRQFNTTQNQQNQQFGQTFSEGQRQYNTSMAEQQRQFDLQKQMEQQKTDLQAEIDRRRLSLEELSQQQQNAIQSGQLELSKQIETEKVRLQGEQQNAQIKLQTAQTSGYMDNGQLTEEARRARAAEQSQQIGMMGVDAQGNRTDASQQWRMNAGLEAARVAAQLSQNPADYFESAALMRNGDVQNALSFLNAGQQGSSMGFRSAASALPQTNSIQNLQGGAPQNPAIPQGAMPAQGQQMTLAAGPEGMPTIGAAPIGTIQKSAQAGPYGGFVPNTQQNVAGDSDAEGPSASLAAAQSAVQGKSAAFTSPMHKTIAGPEIGAGGPAAMDSQFAAAQAQMPTSQGPGPGAAAPQQPSVQGNMAAYNANATMQPDAAQQRLKAIQPVFQAGAHKMAPGSLEAMSPTERGLFASAAKASGIRPEDFESQYKRSKLQTGVSSSEI